MDGHATDILISLKTIWNSFVITLPWFFFGALLTTSVAINYCQRGLDKYKILNLIIFLPILITPSALSFFMVKFYPFDFYNNKYIILTILGILFHLCFSVFIFNYIFSIHNKLKVLKHLQKQLSNLDFKKEEISCKLKKSRQEYLYKFVLAMLTVLIIKSATKIIFLFTIPLNFKPVQNLVVGWNMFFRKNIFNFSFKRNKLYPSIIKIILVIITLLVITDKSFLNNNVLDSFSMPILLGCGIGIFLFYLFEYFFIQNIGSKYFTKNYWKLFIFITPITLWLSPVYIVFELCGNLCTSQNLILKHNIIIIVLLGILLGYCGMVVLCKDKVSQILPIALINNKLLRKTKGNFKLFMAYFLKKTYVSMILIIFLMWSEQGLQHHLEIKDSFAQIILIIKNDSQEFKISRVLILSFVVWLIFYSSINILVQFLERKKYFLIK